MDLLFIAFVIIIIHKWPASGNLAPLSSVNESAFVQDPVHLSMARRKKSNIACLRLAILKDICKINGLFTLFPHFAPSQVYKRTWHRDPHKMVILRQYSWSASFPNKVIFLASTPCLLDSLASDAVNRATLDLVTLSQAISTDLQHALRQPNIRIIPLSEGYLVQRFRPNYTSI